MVMRNVFIYISFIVLFTGCEKTIYDLTDLNQVVIFQTEYINHAWGFQHSGVFIDTLGNARSYSLPNSWNLPDEDSYISKSDLQENYSKAVDIQCFVEEDEIIYYFNKLYQAQFGSLTDPKHVAADAGSTSYFGYLYNSKKDMYKQVLLRQNGDVLIENKSSGAKQIYDWLRNLCKD